MQAPHYKITDLSAGMDALAIYPADVNENGQIVGKLFRGERQENGISIWHAFLWQEGELTLLPKLGGAISVAQAINNRGDIVGSSRTAEATDENPVTHAFLYRDGDIHDLGTLGGPKSFAYGLNNSGQVVGSSQSEERHEAGQPVLHACLWQDGRIVDLGSLGRFAEAVDINGSGQIAGVACRKKQSPVAVTWRDSVIEELPLADGVNAAAKAINAGGEIAGAIGYKDRHHACIWQCDGGVADISASGSDIDAIEDVNDFGQAVGHSRGGFRADHNYPECAFLWSEGSLYDLNDLIRLDNGWKLIEAMAINNAGEIVGRGFFQGEERAFLLTLV